MIISAFPRLRHSFTARLIGVPALVVFLTALAVNYFSYRNAIRELRTQELRHGQSLVRILANSARLGLFTNDQAKLRAAATLIGTDANGLVALFFDDTGKLFLRTGKGTFHDEDNALSAELEERLVSPQTQTAFTLERGSQLVLMEMVRAGAALSEEDLLAGGEPGQEGLRAPPREAPLGYVAIAIDTTDKRQRERQVFLRDMAMTIGLTMVGGLVIWWLVSRLARPLRALVAEIVGQEEGGDARADSGSGVDIPTDFSILVAMIREAYSKVRTFNLTLEERIAERTLQLAGRNQELHRQKDALAHANRRLSQALHQLQTTQANLIQSEKMASLGMMMAGLSHEIKNSLNFVTGSLPLLKRFLEPMLDGGPLAASPLEPGEQVDKIRKLLSHIDEGVSRTVRVVDDLTFFSHGGGQDFAPVDLLPGLKNSVSIIRHEHGRRLSIVEDYGPGLSMVKAISGQINQVFLNVLLNATQAIADTGTITVRTWQDDSFAHVAISDTGHGIDTQIVDRIYDPFFTTKEVGQGTGLGLSISYTIVQNHGGRIAVHSEPGRGASFEIILPLAEGKARAWRAEADGM